MNIPQGLKSEFNIFAFLRTLTSFEWYNGSAGEFFYRGNYKEILEIESIGDKFDFHDLIIEEDKQSYYNEFTKFLSDSENRFGTFIYRIKIPSGKTIDIREVVHHDPRIISTHNNLSGIVYNFSELSEKLFLLIKEISLLRQLNNSKDVFMSVVSHDLRAPFTSLLGFSEILINEPDLKESERQEYVGYLYEASKNQLQLLNYLVDWSKLQTGKLNLEQKRINTKHFIENCITNLSFKASRKDITIRPSEIVEAHIFGDEKLLTQAVSQLISNAISFSQRDSMINIYIKKFKEGVIEIIVKDSGVGIPEEYQDRLFQIEKKFSFEGTAGEKGSGFGLILTKEIINKHDGEIWFYSKEGEGSEFHFTIPEMKNSFLIVEDDVTQRMIYQKLLNKNFPDFGIAEASSGYEGLSSIFENPPSLIITDHDMPLMDGIQFIESMKKGHIRYIIPVIVISGKLTPELLDKYSKLGIGTVIEKPADFDKLVEVIKEKLI